jgi:predicted secreted protein
MVGIIPLNLRSQKTDKGVPHARVRAAAAAGRAGRGVAWRGMQTARGRGVVVLIFSTH